MLDVAARVFQTLMLRKRRRLVGGPWDPVVYQVVGGEEMEAERHRIAEDDRDAAVERMREAGVVGVTAEDADFLPYTTLAEDALVPRDTPLLFRLEGRALQALGRPAWFTPCQRSLQHPCQCQPQPELAASRLQLIKGLWGSPLELKEAPTRRKLLGINTRNLPRSELVRRAMCGVRLAVDWMLGVRLQSASERVIQRMASSLYSLTLARDQVSGAIIADLERSNASILCLRWSQQMTCSAPSASQRLARLRIIRRARYTSRRSQGSLGAITPWSCVIATGSICARDPSSAPLPEEPHSS